MVTLRVGKDWDDFEPLGSQSKLFADGATVTKKIIQKKRKSKTKSREDDFAFQCKCHQLPVVYRQHLFAKSIGRRWQFDFAFPEYRLAIEVEGLVVRKIGGQLVCMGRHASITGFREDCVKYATAVLLGWTVVRFEQSQIGSRYAIEMTIRILMARGWKGANHVANVDSAASAAATA